MTVPAICKKIEGLFIWQWEAGGSPATRSVNCVSPCGTAV